MTAATPLSEVLVDVDRAAVDAQAPTKAAIDRGCSLSKFLYVPKDASAEADHYTFHCALFRNADFEGALYFLKEKALLPSEGKLRVTGAGCDMHKDLIAQVLGLEVEFVQEFLTIFYGVHFLLSHAVSRDALFFPECPTTAIQKLERPKEIEDFVQKELKRVQEKNPTGSDLLPCIYILCGSAAASMLINKDGTTTFLDTTMVGGKALLGLGQAIVGTNKYDELMELATVGNVANIDTTIGEVIKDDPNSPYGRFPSDLPIFNFGKMAESDRPLESYEKADRAAAVVRVCANMLLGLIGSGMRRCQVTNIIIGGNCVKGEVLRQMVTTACKVFMFVEFAPKFLITGHTGAFGAMVGTNEKMALLKNDV